MESRSVRDVRPGFVGRRIVVTGMAGAGKSTFSRALSAKTGLPVIHLDVYFWKPGWVEPSEDEWREKQRGLLAGDEWIADGNYHATLDYRLERAETVVFLDTSWWVCAQRAFVRGIRKRPVGFQLPSGCDEWRCTSSAPSARWVTSSADKCRTGVRDLRPIRWGSQRPSLRSTSPRRPRRVGQRRAREGPPRPLLPQEIGQRGVHLISPSGTYWPSGFHVGRRKSRPTMS